MAEYKSSYTGAEIDAGIAKANTALQATSLDLTEGVDVSTLENGNYFITGEGYLKQGNRNLILINQNSLVNKGTNNLIVNDNNDIIRISGFSGGIVEDTNNLAVSDFTIKNRINNPVLNEGIISFSKNGGVWCVAGIEEEKFTLEFKISTRGLMVYNYTKDEGNNYGQYSLIQLVPAGTSNSNKIGTISSLLASSNVTWSNKFENPSQEWENATSDTMFRVEKNGTSLKIYTADANGYILIFETNDCNMIGFMDTNATYSNLSNATITRYSEGTTVSKSAFSGGSGGGGSIGLESRFENYKVLCIGDSITEKNFRASTNWVEYLDSWLKFNTIVNDGKSGTGIIHPYGTTFKNWYDRIDDYTATSYDLILIMGNMNDYSGHDLDDTTDGQFGDNTFDTEYGTLKLYLDKLITKYPLAKIGWITSTPRQYQSGWADGSLYGVNSLFEGATQAIKKTCSHYGIPVLDLYHESNLMPWIASQNEKYFKADGYASGDGVHPNANGQLVLAYKIYDFVIKNF